MNREQKTVEVKMLTERLAQAKAFIFSGYRGIKVQAITDLRSKLRKEKASLKVVKNRLAKRVFESQGLKDLEKFLDGPTAVTWAEKDSVSVAKVLIEFAKENEALVVRGGFVEGRVLTSKDIEALSKLPSREVLLSRALSSMLAPASNLVGVLAAVPRSLVMAINAIKDKKTA